MRTCKKKCGAGKCVAILLGICGVAALVWAYTKWIKKYLSCKCGKEKSIDEEPDLDFDFDEEADTACSCGCPSEEKKTDETENEE